jgi:hypothetical protein
MYEYSDYEYSELFEIEPKIVDVPKDDFSELRGKRIIRIN